MNYPSIQMVSYSIFINSMGSIAKKDLQLGHLIFYIFVFSVIVLPSMGHYPLPPYSVLPSTIHAKLAGEIL